jgi:hypothetical protein
MALLTPLLQTRRRSAPPPAGPVPAPPQEWHVGLSRKGMFPHDEASCPCPKAACGLVIPQPEVFCPVHQGPRPYQQLHPASECGFPRHNWLPRPGRRTGKNR